MLLVHCRVIENYKFCIPKITDLNTRDAPTLGEDYNDFNFRGNRTFNAYVTGSPLVSPGGEPQQQLPSVTGRGRGRDTGRGRGRGRDTGRGRGRGRQGRVVSESRRTRSSTIDSDEEEWQNAPAPRR